MSGDKRKRLHPVTAGTWTATAVVLVAVILFGADPLAAIGYGIAGGAMAWFVVKTG